MPNRSVMGWKLPREERERLMRLFPPVYPDVVADHVTSGSREGKLPEARQGRIVGAVDDEEGLQALVVEIAGTTARPDGSTYHITWSLDRGAGRKPVQSNDVLRERGWEPLNPITIALEPASYG